MLAYNSCEKTFRTPKDLNKHALNNVEVESCPQNVNAWELTSNDITEVQTHTLGHGEEETRYHGGNLFADLKVHVNTMESDEFENVAESTRLTLSMPNSLENGEETIQCNECNYAC